MSETDKAKLVRLSDTDFTLGASEEDIRGHRVFDGSGEEIGHVNDLLVDEREVKVRFLEVAAGGFLGLGERKFLIPVDAVTRIERDEVHVDQTREHVIAAPEYDPEVVQEETYWNDLYGYWGYAPFWTPGYAYPAYPYYA